MTGTGTDSQWFLLRTLNAMQKQIENDPKMAEVYRGEIDLMLTELKTEGIITSKDDPRKKARKEQ